MIDVEGGWVVGFCGKDGYMVIVCKLKCIVVDLDSKIESVVDFGFVGEFVEVDLIVLKLVLKEDIILVVVLVVFGEDGEIYNINVDICVGVIVGVFDVEWFLFLIDVLGVFDKDGKLIK